MVAWIMRGYILVDNKIDLDAWIMHGCECMDNAWILRDGILVGNKMDNTYCMDNAWTMYGYVSCG